MKDNFLTLTLGKTVVFLISVLMLTCNFVQAQDTLLVKGVIVSGTDKPVSNVAVSVEGSFNLPVITNNKGEFEIKSTSPGDWIIVAPSSTYKMKRVFLNGRTELKVFLTNEDIVSGDDEVSILSQKKLKRNVVSSFSDLDFNTLKYTSAITVDQHMQGQIPGLLVVNRSGDPGSGAMTLLRGISSLNSNNDPLYMVDGILLSSQSLFGSNLDGYSYNPLLGINPLDISKTTVVKDPLITAAYGSKASNGLIVIETLDPSATATSIEVDLRSGYSMAPTKRIPQMNAGQHKTLINEVLFTSGKFSEDIQEEYPNLFLAIDDDRYIDYQHNTNWQDLIFTNSFFNNVNVKVKGGDEIARYGLSLGYVDSKGIMKTTEYQGYNLRFVSLLNIFTWLKMNASVGLNYSNSNLKESAKVKETNPILASLVKSPLLGPYQYDLDGNMLTTLSEVDELGVSNPLAIINNFEATNNNYNFTSSLGFSVLVNDNLDLSTNFGLNYNVLKEQLYMPNLGMERYYNKEAINVSKVSNNNLTSFYNNTNLNYRKQLGKNHMISSVTGVNMLNNVFEYDWGLTKNAHQNDEYRMIQDGTNNLREIGGQNKIWNWISLYENLSYSYKDKYLVSASVSLDGSSRIGKNAKNTIKMGSTPLGVFYSGGVAWRISNESFLKNASWMEELKLRVTYGTSGNDDVGESNASNYYQSVKFRETVGLYPAIIPNDELTYETVTQVNLGLDLSVLGNRFRASFDVFDSKSSDMLIYSPVDSYLGFNFRPENGGKLQNVGWELNTFLRLVEGKAFKWDIQASISTSANEILEIKGDKIVTDIAGAQIVNMTGEAANSFYGYVFNGVFSTQAEANSANLKNDRDVKFQAGDAMFSDLSGPGGIPDGIINDYDKTIIGSATPEYYGGLINSFQYKRWTLSGSVQFITGREVFNYLRFKNEQMDGFYNQSTRVLSRWQYEGQETDVPRAQWKDPVGNSDFSTRWIEDGSFLKVKNVTLSYKIPNKFLTFKDAEFYVSANNILTLSEYLGYDPEFAYSHSQIDQGIDYGLTPQPRQFIVGIKLGL